MDTWCFVKLDPTFPKSGYITFGVIEIIFCPITVAANTLLIVSLYATKQSFRIPSNFLILCLSVSDGLIGAILMPLVGFHNIFIDSQTFCATRTTSYTLRSFFAGTSLYMTILLAVDRYLHMNPNYQHSPPRLAKFFKPPRVYFLALTFWIVAAAISIAFYFSTLTKRESFFYFATFITALATTAMTVFIVMYARGYLRLRSIVAENPVYTRREESNSNERPEYVTRLFKTVLLLLIAIFVSWFPNLILKILITINYSREEPVISSPTFTAYTEACFVLYYSNCFVNAFILLHRNKKSREWLTSLRGSCRRERREDVQCNTTVIFITERAAEHSN